MIDYCTPENLRRLLLIYFVLIIAFFWIGALIIPTWRKWKEYRADKEEDIHPSRYLWTKEEVYSTFVHDDDYDHPELGL